MTERRKRPRRPKAAKALVKRILDVLNFRLPENKPPGRKRLYGDSRPRMGYETLFECQTELDELMGSWVDSGCVAAKWPVALRRRLAADLSRRELCLVPDDDGRLTYDFTRPAYMIDLGLGGGFKADSQPGRTEAIILFFQFVTGPLQRDVGRCKRCRKFYLNEWGHQNKEYCGKRCATSESATRTMHQRRREERQAKLRAVKIAIKKFERLPAAKRATLMAGWTKWVAGQAGPEVTPNFVTRRINAGELKPPRFGAV